MPLFELSECHIYSKIMNQICSVITRIYTVRKIMLQNHFHSYFCYTNVTKNINIYSKNNMCHHYSVRQVKKKKVCLHIIVGASVQLLALSIRLSTFSTINTTYKCGTRTTHFTCALTLIFRSLTDDLKRQRRHPIPLTQIQKDCNQSHARLSPPLSCCACFCETSEHQLVLFVIFYLFSHWRNSLLLNGAGAR